MKQGRTEKAVFAKLSTEKVELNLANDLKNASGEIVKEITFVRQNLKDIEKFEEQFLTAKDELKRNIRDLEISLSEGIEIKDKFERMAKELGIDPSDNRDWKTLKDKVEESRKLTKDAEKFIK